MGNMGKLPTPSNRTAFNQTFSTPTGTSHTLTHSVTSEDDIMLVINNVIQEPTVAYTASGTTLTTDTLVSGDTMYVVYLVVS